jgi:asparagine synthase (glutamine-hydrolysing)
VLREKSVLRDALGSFLPGDIAQRTKQPYRAPDSASFFVNGRTLEYVDRQFSRKRLSQAGIFSPDVATLLFEKCRAGKAIGFADNMAFVGLLSTMLLEEQLIQGLAPG